MMTPPVSEAGGTQEDEMDLEFTPAQRAFRAEVRAFIDERLPADIRARLRAGHPPRKQDTVTWQRILNERG